MKKRRNKTPEFRKLKFLHNSYFSLIIVFLLLILIASNDFELTGFSVIYSDEVVEETPNLILDSNYVYNSIIDVENFDHIKSIKLTGRVGKEGIVKVYYNDILILDNNALVSNNGEITGLSILNETFEENESVNESENVNINFVLLDFDDYCLDSCNLFINNSEITLNFEIINSSIEIDEITYTVVKKEEELEPATNKSEVTLNDGIVVEEDIEWTKIVELEEVGRVNVGLPPSARNIRVNKIVNEEEIEVKNDRFSINNPNLFELANQINISIFDDALKYKIYYKTPGPNKDESITIRDKHKILKNISVSSDIELENITSYVNLPNVLKQQIKLRWYDINNSQWIDITSNETYNLTYYDNNGDGKYERVYWSIPHLSDQEFSLEINLLILNVQSYPVVGGNWTVYFNTTGTADLTIEAVDGTTWSNSNDNEDLRFLELKCGNNLVNYTWIDNKVFVSNYNCDGLTSIKTSKVISGGSHHLKFTFGNLFGFADNFAYAPNSGLLVYSNNNVTCATRQYYSNGTWTNPIACLPLDTSEVPNLINLYSSKTRNETIMLMKGSTPSGIRPIWAHVWNGTSWTNKTKLVNNVTATVIYYRGYDGCYLNNGDFMVIHPAETIATNAVYFRIWNGTVWSGNISIVDNIGSIPFWIDVRCRPDQNEVLVAIEANTPPGTNVNADIFTFFFNNTSGYTTQSWTMYNHTATAPDLRFESMDLEWSNNDTSRGILMYANGTSPTVAIGKTWNSTNGNLTWSNGFISPTFGYTIGDVIVRAHPNNETFNNSFLVGVSRGNLADPAPTDAYLIHNYTPGFKTIVSGNVTNTSDSGQQRDFDIAWEKSGGEALMVFNFSSNAVHYRLYNATNGSTSEMKNGGATMGSVNNEVLILKPDPKSSDDMMLVILDTGQNIGTKLWNGTLNTFSTLILHGAGVGPTASDFNFWADFEWDRFEAPAPNPPPNWSSPAMNQTNLFKDNKWINFTTIWSDDSGLSGYIFEINQTNNYVNSSFILFPGTGKTQNSSNVSLIVAGANANITWRFYANDTNNAWNVTSLQSFIVGVPNVTLSFPANNSNHIGDNISFQCNITDDIAISNVTLYHNINGTFVPNITRDYGEIDLLSGSDGYVLIYHLNNDSMFGENDSYVYDFSKNNNNGTLKFNALNYPQVNYTGKFRNNFLFASDGGDPETFGFINVSGRSSTLNISTNQVTVMAWLNQDPGNGVVKRVVIAKVINDSGPPAFTYGLYYDGGPVTGTVHKGNEFITAWSGASRAAGVWYHVAMTFNGTTLKVYSDGLLRDSNSTGSGGLNATGPGDLRIGSQSLSATGFKGRIDEVVILNRSLSDEEIFQLYNRSLAQKSASENFTFTNIHNLTGIFRWNCLAYDNETQLDWADANWTFTFNTSVAPNVTSGPTLAPNNPTTIHDLNCSFTVSDEDYWNTLRANVTWRRNNTLMMAFNISVPNGAAAQNILHNANTTKFDTWNCTVTPFDGIHYGTNVSAAIGILNNFPDNVTMLYPANGSNVQDRRPLFNWTNSSDPDNDRFNFTILIDDDINFASPEVNVSTYSNNFTPTNPLPLISGGNTRYFWTVTAYDDTNRTAFNGTVTYTFVLQSIVQIAIRNNTIGFAGLNPLQTDNTEDDSPYPITVENDGTTMINVNISRIDSDLWRTQSSPSGYFMYKIANFTGEEGAFDWIGSVTTFTNVPIVNVTAISKLNFTNSTDIVRVEINVTVPSAEPAGDRSTNLSFTAIIAEEEIGN